MGGDTQTFTCLAAKAFNINIYAQKKVKKKKNKLKNTTNTAVVCAVVVVIADVVVVLVHVPRRALVSDLDLVLSPALAADLANKFVLNGLTSDYELTKSIESS